MHQLRLGGSSTSSGVESYSEVDLKQAGREPKRLSDLSVPATVYAAARRTVEFLCPAANFLLPQFVELMHTLSSIE